MIQKIIDYIRQRRAYAIADPSDNSITLSKGVLRMLRKQGGANRILVVKVGVKYAFVIDPDVKDDETQIAHLQYNSRYNCYGFECLVPPVHRMLADMIPEREYNYSEEPVKLMVKKKKAKGVIYYEMTPKGK